MRLSRALRRTLLLTVVLAAGAIPLAATPSTAASTLPSLYVSPQGAPGPCTAAKPCGSFDQAYRVARPSQVVLVAGGRYPSQTIRYLAKRTAGYTVTFRPRTGARVVIASMLEVSGSDVLVRDMTVDGRVRLRTTAAGSKLHAMVLRGSVLVDAPRSAVTGSVITPQPDQDGIDVRYGQNVLIADNTIGPGVRGPKKGHVDCIQVMGGSDITIRDNRLFRCATQQILIKPDEAPIQRVRVTGNRITGCGTRTAACDGYVAVQVRTAGRVIENVVVESNVVDGALYADDIPGLAVRHNRIDQLSRCGAWAYANTVQRTGSGCTSAAGSSPTAPAADYAPRRAPVNEAGLVAEQSRASAAQRMDWRRGALRFDPRPQRTR